MVIQMKKKGLSMVKEFKKFIMRGNVIDLAVGVIIGGAFGKIVTSLVNDMIMPLLGLILGRVNLSELKYVITPATEETAEVAFKYGAFIQSIIDFLIIALCIFIIVKIFNAIKSKFDELEKPEAPVTPAPPPEPPKNEVLLGEIRDLLKEINKK